VVKCAHTVPIHGLRNSMNFKHAYVRILIKFHVLWRKMPCRCHNLLKEGLGTYITSYEIVHWWVNAIIMQCGKMGHMLPAVVWQQLPLMQSVQCTAQIQHGNSYMVIADEMVILPASLFCICTKYIGKQKICTEWIPHDADHLPHWWEKCINFYGNYVELRQMIVFVCCDILFVFICCVFSI